MAFPSVKRFGVGVCLAIGVGVIAASSLDAGSAAVDEHVVTQVEPQLAAADNTFGLKLFAALQKHDSAKNVFISPSSVALALAMVYNGAGTTTKDAMAATLGLQGMTIADVNKANSDLIAVLQNPDPKVKLTIADSLWVRSGFSIKDNFAQRLQQSYGARLTNLDFASPAAPATINRWVSDATYKKIPTIVDKISPDEMLFLINAIYFNGTWTRQFDPKDTSPGPFTLADGKEIRTFVMPGPTPSTGAWYRLAEGTRIQTPMMHQRGWYSYTSNDKFQAIRLPYGSERLALYVFLPSPGSSVKELVSSMDSATWDQWIKQLHGNEGTISLPRFKTEYSATLNDALAALGMGIAFDATRADFSGISEKQVWISTVKHKTYLDVNELGTEAAAVTSIGMSATAMPTNPFNMVVDRPFVLAIRDDTSGAILFSGAIQDPR